MTRIFGNERMVAGILLVLSFAGLIGSFAVVLSSGADFSRMIDSSQSGLEEIGRHVTAFRRSNLLAIPPIMFALLGFGILSDLLRDAGDRILAPMAFVAFLVGTILFTLDLAFHSSVTAWAAETVRNAAVPDFYPALRQWIGTLQAITIVTDLVSLIGYGGSILQTGLLPQWLGWGCVGWGVVWLVMAFASLGVPVAVVYLMPPVIGIVLMVVAE